MSEITSFLSANPLIALALVILLIIFILSVLKKLFKIALVIGIILLLAGGTVNHFARKQFDAHGKELLDRGKALLREGKEKIEKTITDELSSPPATDSTSRTADRKSAKKPRSNTAAKRARQM
jgi:hypothetical protein